MRNEREMLDLIVDVARNDKRIRAVLMEGSRANPAVSKDKYQDYDIVYYVEDVTPFYNNLKWIENNFGKPVIVQMPEIMTLIPPENDGNFTYLMIFEDGNRIDLSFVRKPDINDGEPAMVLLDKDGLLPLLPAPSGKYWHIKPPNKKLFSDCCNEFWWCLNNVGKGIARDELPYTMKMLNVFVRDMLDYMIEWYIGIKTGFSVSAGKFGKYFKKYLPNELYEKYLKSYSDTDYNHLWDAVFSACDLFHTVAHFVAIQCGYIYNQCEEKAMLDYLYRVKREIS